MIDTCKTCGEQLYYKETIHAALGNLYCSRKCGVQDIDKEFGAGYFDAVSDELAPSEIGIMPPEIIDD